MGFVDALASNPSGSVYNGSPRGREDYSGALSIFKQLKDREMDDYQKKALFDARLAERQEQRMRNLFDPNKQQQGGKQNTEGMDVVMAQDPNIMTGYQKGQLGVRQQEINLDSQRLGQQGRLGQQALDIRGEQQDLNQQKSDQINANKQAQMEQQIRASDARIQIAKDSLEQRNNTAEAQIRARADLAAAVEERHRLELANKQHEFDISSGQRDTQIGDMQRRLDQDANSETTTELNADGTRRVTTTRRGTPQADPMGIR